MSIRTASSSAAVRKVATLRDVSGRGRPGQRQKLYLAAQRVLTTKSIFDATVNDIVREAGVAQGTFYIYFIDKFELLKSLATDLVAEMTHDVRSESERYQDKLEQLEHFFLVAIGRWQAHSDVYRAVFQLAMIRQDFHEIRDQLQLPLRQARSTAIARDQASGVARKDIDPGVAALAMQRMYELICMEWFGRESPPYPGASLETVARELARVSYHMLYPDGLAVTDGPESPSPENS